MPSDGMGVAEELRAQMIDCSVENSPIPLLEQIAELKAQIIELEDALIHIGRFLADPRTKPIFELMIKVSKRRDV